MTRFRNRSTFLTALAVLAVLLIGITVAATIPYTAFEEALCCIPLADTDRILGAIRLGLEQEGFSGEDVLRLIVRLVDHPAS
ncbi:hypothetical protein ACFLR0_02720, partial [Candidatus Bipolaricaulota bacterium]